MTYATPFGCLMIAAAIYFGAELVADAVRDSGK